MNVRHLGMGLLAVSMTALLTVLPSGCNDDDPDTSELDGYFESHPYVSDPRSDPRQVVSISPESATLNAVGARAVFTANGGTPPYGWDVANGSLGSISPGGAAEATYTATSVGVNDVIVHDRDGNAAIAHISGTPPAGPSALSASANPSTLTTNTALSVLKATGGTAPYRWTLTDAALGTLVTDTGASVIYQRIRSGDNGVTVRDGSGQSTSLIISQP